LIIKIDLGGGKFASVTAKKNSNPLKVATKFCKDYSLPVAIIEPLRSRIESNMELHYQSGVLENTAK